MTVTWTVAFVALWLVVLLLAFVSLGFLRRASAVLERVEELLAERADDLRPGGLRKGNAVPSFRVADAEGFMIDRDHLLGHPSVVVFLDAECEPCRALIQEMESVDLQRLEVTLLVRLDQSAGLHLSGAKVLPDEHGDFAAAFQTRSSPHGFGINSAGFIVENRIVNSFDQLRELAELSSKGGEIADNHFQAID